MAKIGMKYFATAPISTDSSSGITYGTGKIIAKACAASLKVNKAEGKLFADNMLAEYATKFTSADLSVELDDVALADLADCLDATYSSTDKKMTCKVDDLPGYRGWGYCRNYSKGGTERWETVILKKGQMKIPDDEDASSNDSISFGTVKTDITCIAGEDGEWRTVAEYTSEASALSALKSALSIT